MARQPAVGGTIGMPKAEPHASITWDGDSTVRLSGDTKQLALGKRVRLVLEGPCTGFSMREYGCSIDVKPKTIRVEALGDATDDDESEPMAESIEKLKGRTYAGKKGK